MFDITDPVVNILGSPQSVNFDITNPVVNILGVPQLFSCEYVGSSESNLSSAANITAFAAYAGSGESSLTANSIVVAVLASSMSAETSLTVSANLVLLSMSMSAGSSDLNATGIIGYFANGKPMLASSDMSASLFTVGEITADPLSGQSDLVATMFEPLNILVLPTVEYNYSKVRLMQFYGIDSGQSLIITGTNGRIVEYQTGTEIEAADYYFGGGRRHVLDDAEVTAVTNAGFGNLITIEGVPSGV